MRKTGILWQTLDDYSGHREDQSGKSCVDLAYEPITRMYPVILIEFKHGGSSEGIAQLKAQEYFRRYADRYRDIIVIGITYSTDTKEHRCIPEKMDYEISMNILAINIL